MTARPTLAGAAPWPEALAARWRAAGYWTGQSLAAMLRARAAEHPDRTALVDPAAGRFTYREVDERASRVAAGLGAAGIRPGDRVVVQLPNVVEFVDTCFGLFRLGALPVFALPAHRRSEIGYFCRFTAAAAYVVGVAEPGLDPAALAGDVRAGAPALRRVFVVGGRAGGPAHSGGADGLTPWTDLLAPAPAIPHPDPAASDVAFLQLSGGTTGTPKLIPRTHDEYLYTLRESARICRLSADSVYLAALPAAHNFTMSSPGWLGALCAGARVVLSPDPSPDTAFALIAAERVTITALVPPLALLWLAAAEAGARGRDLSSLQVLQVGGAKFAENAARRVRPALGCALQQVFGMAEGLVNYTRLDDPEAVVVGTQGRPISPDDELLILDEHDAPVPVGEPGHLLTRGPYTIRGYYDPDGSVAAHNARSFTADGFYRTGDIVRMSSSGNLVVEGRAKDQINRGGEKVAAEEVENHLLAHPQVHDAAVVAIPDDLLGERICAFVIPAGGARLRATDLTRFLRERGIATYKIPDRCEFVDAFPGTGIGKTSRRELRAALAAHHQEKA